MTKEQLTKERILTKITMSEVGQNINPLYKEKLLRKMENINENFNIKTSFELANYKFIGVPSYDLRVR